MRFEWDESKASSNLRKHGLGFQEAAELFEAEGDFLEGFDENHSDGEERYIAIGPIRTGVITVIYTERNEEVIRIISARRATKNEVRLFRRHMGSI